MPCEGGLTRPASIVTGLGVVILVAAACVSGVTGQSTLPETQLAPDSGALPSPASETSPEPPASAPSPAAEQPAAETQPTAPTPTPELSEEEEFQAALRSALFSIRGWKTNFRNGSVEFSDQETGSK